MNGYSAESYTVVWLFKTAIEKAGSTDGAAVRDADVYKRQRSWFPPTRRAEELTGFYTRHAHRAQKIHPANRLCQNTKGAQNTPGTAAQTHSTARPLGGMILSLIHI